MSDTPKRYYLAKGKDAEIVLGFFRERNAAVDTTISLASEFGGKPITNGHRMVGVLFNGEPPASWKKAGQLDDGRAFYLPSNRSKAGKADRARILSAKIPGASDLHSKFSKDGGVFGEGGPRGGFYIHYITAEIVHGQAIIHVPEKMDFAPPESEPLKNSEYWRIKETPAPELEAAS